MSRPPVSEPRLKIAIIITELSRGGAEKIATQLALQLTLRGHQVSMISLKVRPTAPRDSLVRELEAASIPLHYLNLQSSRQTFSGIAAVRRILLAERPHIVQTMLHHAGVVGTLGARLAGVKNVFQGIRVSDPRWSVRQIDRLISMAAKRVICVSDSVRAVAETSGIPAGKLLTIPNGVDFPETIAPLDRSTLPIPANARFLLSIGRLDRQKGFDKLLPLLPTIFEQHRDLHWLIAGVGTDQELLAAQARQLGLGKRLHFLGFRSDTFSLIQASEVVVLPSIYEGMPNVALETIAAGQALVANQTDGIGEIFAGHTFRSEQVAQSHVEMIPRIEKLLTDKGLRQRVGDANREHAESHFTWHRMVDQYEHIYRDITATT